MSTNTPSPAVISERLEAQRKRVFQVQGIIGTAARTAHAASISSQDEGEHMRSATDLWMALEHAHELLEGIAGSLEPAVVLDAEEESAAA